MDTIILQTEGKKLTLIKRLLKEFNIEFKVKKKKKEVK